MNKRTFWNGLGIGLIVGSVLLQLMLPASGDSPSAKGAEPSKSGTDKKYTEAEFTKALEAKVKEELDKRPSPTPAPSAQASSGNAAAKQTVLYVASGLSSEKVVEMLYQSGLVSDPIGFADLLKKRDLNGKIRSGVHLFTGLPGTEAIIENLTH